MPARRLSYKRIVCDQIAHVLQVYHVRNKMDKVGLDMLLDIHGDEELPYNFINGNEVRQASYCGDWSAVGLPYTHFLCSKLSTHRLDLLDNAVLSAASGF